MSITIPQAFINQYDSMVHILYQQRGTVLRNAVRIKQSNAEFCFFERVGPTAAVENPGRHAPSVQVDTQHTKRAAVMSPFDWGDQIDTEDDGLIWPDNGPRRNMHRLFLATTRDGALGSTLKHEICHAVMATRFPQGKRPRAAALSPDASRLAVAWVEGGLSWLDIEGTKRFSGGF